MPPPSASCPSCGAPLAFRPGTMVSVCGYCKAISARTDRDPLLLGKVADLADTRSPLRLGMTGQHAGHTYTLAGRTQLKHPLGGVWDEWYLAFPNDRWGWLAEVQGHYFLSFQSPLELIPPQDSLPIGEEIDLGKQGRWTVGEVSEATFHAAEGEIPWAVELGATYPFADLSGLHGAFATLDYSEDPALFFSGRETTLEELKLAPPAQGGAATAPRLKALSLNCPKCGGPLALRAPDQAERVGCPSCGALLDATGGKLLFLKSLKQPHAKSFIPLGQEGLLRGHKVICIGQLLRSTTIDGIRYPWSEYLLLVENQTFVWLVESDGHWSWAEGITPAEVRRSDFGLPSVTYKGQTYRRYQDSEAVVEGVWGEFFWKVEQGERAKVSEFVQPPFSLSEERQKHKGSSGEVNWTLATYLQPAEVWAGFKLTGTPPPAEGVASFMPNPHRELAQKMGLWMILAFACLIGLMVIEGFALKGTIVYNEQIQLEPHTPGEGGNEPIVFSQPFEIKEARRNLELTLTAPVENAWVAVEGALVNEGTGTSDLFELSSSYYHGVDGGESWSEGDRTASVFISAVPPGTYTLRLAPQWEGSDPPVPAFTLQLRHGVFRWSYAWLAFFAILVAPVIQYLRSSAFEGRRWAESMYPGQGG